MRSHSRLAAFASIFLVASITTIASPSAAQAAQTDSNLFILDVSGSTDSVALWRNLRVSVTSKLSQPFGNPKIGPIPYKRPVDVSITSVSRNSQNSPIFSIVTNADAKKMWGAVEQVFPSSTDARLKLINAELFGVSGVWASQAKIFARSKIVAPTAAACRTSTLNSINKGPFLKNTDASNKAVLASAVCERIISIAKSLKQADDYFATPACDPSAVCSDIAGAVYRATSLAADLGGTNNGNKLCIAIASDMLNESPGVSTTSILNSKHVAKTASSLESAKATGARAANSVGIRFPSDVSTRVVMVGIGTGQNPLPLDRNSYLLAYWEGFFTQSGVRQTDQAQSLNQACS
jgi:hypothetical protein